MTTILASILCSVRSFDFSVNYFLYAVTDRIPRVYPWMNEPDGGMLNEWNMLRQHTASIFCVTTLSGYASTAVGS